MAAVALDRGPAGCTAARPALRVVRPPERHCAPTRRPRAVYRRRRMAVAAAVVVAATVAVVALGALAGGAPPALRSVPAAGPPTTVVVGQGETLWDLAERHAPAGAHPMAYVIEVAAYNDVDPLAVAPGTALRLPPVSP